MTTRTFNSSVMAALIAAMVALALFPAKASANNCNYTDFSSGTLYQYNDLVSNAGGLYRCKVAGWCASTADWAYAPGAGLYWTEAWKLESQCGAPGDTDTTPDTSPDNNNGSNDGDESDNNSDENSEESAGGDNGDSQSGNEDDNTPDNSGEQALWRIDNDASAVQFITVKKEHVAEVQHFTAISGSVNQQGKVRFHIELASVDTAISIRDERLRNFLFETDLLPELELLAETDISALRQLPTGTMQTLNFTGELQLHGIYQTIDAELVALKLPDNAIQVSTTKPIMINAANFAMDGGVEYLRELANLSAIGNTVPVYLNLVLRAEQDEYANLATTPAIPSGLSAGFSEANQSIALDWNINNENTTHYVLQSRLDNGFWTSAPRIDSATGQYEYTPKSSGEFSFRILAVNNSRPSALSSEVSISVMLDGDDGADENEDNNTDTASPAELYATDCAACHGASGEGSGGIPALTDPGYTLATLTSTITDTMPFGDAGSCIGDCASDLAQYILDNFVDDQVSQNQAPAAPSSVIAVASGSQDRIGLSWTDNSAVESGYKIFRKKDSGQWNEVSSLPSDRVSYQDLQVDIGHSYTYRVQAFNAAGESLAITSNTLELVEQLSLPSAPSTVQVQRDLEALLVSWNTAAGQVESYIVQRSVNEGGWSKVADLAANQRSYEDRNVSAGMEYRYRVRAVNSAGNSEASQVVSIALPADLEQRIVFEAKCATCHSPSGIGGDLLGDFIKLDWADKQYAQMLDKVMTMPAPDCDADCKEDAASFVWSDVWGYSKEVEVVGTEGRGVRTIRLLTPYEYRNAVFDLTGVVIADEDLPKPHFNDEFKYPTQAELGLVLTEEALEFMRLAENIAAEADLSKLGCSAAGCSNNQISSALERLMRRAPEASEVSTFQSFNSTHGSRDMLASILMSPYFLYRTEIGEWNDAEQAYQLNDFEVASALSFQIFGSTPDSALLTAARNGQLRTAAQVESKAQQMLLDSRFAKHFSEFIRYYTKTYDEVADKPGLDQTLIAAMRSEQEKAVAYLLEQGSGTLNELFNPDYTFVNNVLGQHYGMAHSGSSSFAKVNTSAERGGILHQGILHVANSDFAATSLVKRGKMIRENMMCHTMGVPSGIDPDTIEMPNYAYTTRERWDIITGPDASEGQCWQCHRLMNEPGSALEAYDQEGRYRNNEPAYNNASISLAIDASGILRDNSGLANLALYADARELSQTLAGMDEVRDCFVESYMQYTSGHEPDSLVRPDQQVLSEQFVADGDIRALAMNVIKAESFLYRLER